MPEDVKVVVEPEVKDTSQEPVDVTPAPKVGEDDQLASKIKADFEALYGSRIKQTEDRLHGAYRINEKLQREVDQLKQQTVAPKPAAAPSTDPWSGIENGQVWKQEIEKLAEQKAQSIIQQRETESRTQQYVAIQAQTQDASKRQVIAKYPDLDPETGTVESTVSKAYTSVLAEHPDWLTNPYGPTLAMYAMEEKLRGEAASAGSPAKPRLQNPHLPPSRPVASGGERLTLTREQKQFCDRHNMKYEDFLKTATALEQGSVEA